MNLCPETETDPMGFLKDTRGAFLMNGICRCAAMAQQLHVRDEAFNGSQYAQDRAPGGGTCSRLFVQQDCVLDQALSDEYKSRECFCMPSLPEALA